MSDQNPPPVDPTGASAPGAQTPSAQPAPPQHASPLPPPQAGLQPYATTSVAPYGANGPIGKVRNTGTCFLLMIVTLGIYSYFWYYGVTTEMKRHSGNGIGGVVALILAFFVNIVMPFIVSSEVGNLYESRGESKPVSGATGLWYFPGMFILIGPFVWFIKTNGAINAYWRSLGAS